MSILTVKEVLEELVLMPEEEVVTIAKGLLAFEMLGEYANNPTDQLMEMVCAKANAEYDEYFRRNPSASLFANSIIANVANATEEKAKVPNV